MSENIANLTYASARSSLASYGSYSKLLFPLQLFARSLDGCGIERIESIRITCLPGFSMSLW